MEILSFTFKAYCDMTTSGQAWTLIGRFSNNDAKNWMKDSGEWWYDKSVALDMQRIQQSRYADMHMQICSRQHSGWSEVSDSRSRVVMTHITPPCYGPQVTVWVDRQSVRKWKVMVTL